MHQCPECGAIYEGIDTCQTIFDSFLALEFTNPSYGSVHFLTVSCYMIQHNRYSDRGLIWIHGKLSEFLDHEKSVQQIRQESQIENAQDTRNWKFLRQDGERPSPHVDWSFTISDVAVGFTDAATYCALVIQWAKSVRQEMGRLLPDQ